MRGGGHGGSPNETLYAAFIFGMFGFFSCGMFVSQNYMFGPNSPGGLPLIYWTKGSDHPISEWWSRMTGVLFLSFLSGYRRPSALQCQIVHTVLLLLLRNIVDCPHRKPRAPGLSSLMRQWSRTSSRLWWQW